MPQLAQGLGLDLANPLAGDAEIAANFFEGAELAVFQPVAQDDDPALAVGQFFQRIADLGPEQAAARQASSGAGIDVVLDEITEERVTFRANRCFKRDRVAGDIQHLPHLVVGNRHRTRHLGVGWLAFEDLLQPMGRLLDPVDGFADVDRKADRAALVGDRAGDRLANPPCGIGAELESPVVVELVGGLHQADVAFLDQIEEREAAAAVLLGDGYDQPQVGLDQVRARGVAVLPVDLQ